MTGANQLDNEQAEYLLESAVEDVYDAVMDEVEDEDLDEDALWFREELQKHKTLGWLYRPSVIQISVALFMFSISTAIGSPANQVVLYQLSCNSVAKDGICDPVAAQLLFSTFSQFQMVALGVLPIIISSRFGELSDRFGRKPFIATIFVGVATHKVINYFLITKSNVLPFNALLIFDFICSAFGGMAPLVAMLQSYVTDVIAPHERTFSIGLVSASLLVGQALGPILSSFMVSLIPTDDGKGINFDLNSIEAYIQISKKQLYPMRIELVILILVALYGVFILPESRGEKARSKSRSNSMASDIETFQQLRALQHPPSFWKKASHYINVFKPLALLTYPSSAVPNNQKQYETRNRLVVYILILAAALCNSTIISMGQITVQYGMLKFQWGAQEIGYFMSVYSTSAAIVLVFLSPILTKVILQQYFKFKTMKRQIDLVDISTLIFGRGCDAIAFLAMVYSTNTPQFLSNFCILALGAPANPAATASLLKFFPASKTGEFFGAMALLHSLLGLFMPVLMMGLFKYFITEGTPQFTYLAYSGINLVYIVFILGVKRIMNISTSTREDELRRRSSSVSFANYDSSH
ncbi:multidrug efflux protein [Scheffersomyces coipomensis]|uniref:multidrug efflux protein n=1 Tax=Scheffersomyces coipomensis TaxID=1788519 RepID=UPI00315DF1A7